MIPRQPVLTRTDTRCPYTTLFRTTRVMLSEGSTATLTYPDGAVVNLTEPGVYTVSAAGSRLVRTQGNTAAANAMMLGIAGVIAAAGRSEEHTSELQSLMRISYAVFCLQQQKRHSRTQTPHIL